jgi:hypothetical protein
LLLLLLQVSESSSHQLILIYKVWLIFHDPPNTSNTPCGPHHTTLPECNNKHNINTTTTQRLLNGSDRDGGTTLLQPPPPIRGV